MTNPLTEKSKFISYVLRHKPDAVGLTLNREGWIDIDLLLSKATKSAITRAELEQIVAEDEKGRYTIDGNMIRANQGHSTSQVKLTFKKAVPPVVLFHGAATAMLTEIMKKGLKPMARHHVHLSHDRATAEIVGGRRRKGYTVLTIDAKRMLADGLNFYISDNGVWLVDAVPSVYLSESKT
jgi:putative RNA 2'-phosphotransferase